MYQDAVVRVIIKIEDDHRGKDMATIPITEVIQPVRRQGHARDVTGRNDGQLLEDFIRHRDEAAFAALVHRHGPMVWGVCHRVLCNFHNAEDAFQATFLVLVRKAASIVPRAMVPNWLYGVAYQTALKAKATAAKRRARERQMTDVPETEMVQQFRLQELQLHLDQALSRLPDKYRIVILLCDLQGRTRKEAAHQLGVPEGTVGGRLARARTMLARRLTRQGLAVSGGALAMALAQNSASASAPATVVSATIKAANLIAAGQAAAAGATSLKVATLIEGVLKTMLLTKLNITLVGLSVIVALGGAAGLIYRTQAAEQKTPPGAAKTNDEKQSGANKNEKASAEVDKLQGTWEFHSMTAGGTTWQKDQLPKTETPWKSITITGDKLRRVNRKLRELDDGNDLVFEDRIKLDPSQEPKAVDLIQLDDDRGGLKKGNTVTCVYELDKDLLRLCFPGGNQKERPSAVESPVGSSNLILTFKKVQKK